MKILLTGGGGFIGSNIARQLESEGHKITIIDSFLTGTEDNLIGIKAKIIRADISRPFCVDGKFDAIIHEAAITDPRFEDDAETIRANIEGFKNIISLAKKHGAKLVYASSASMYGNGPVPMKEDQEKELLSAYAKSKLAMDSLAEHYFGSMRIVGLRYFNVFGPGEAHKGRPASMIYHLAMQMLSGKAPRLFRYGEQKRDHVYVKDACNATVLALNAKKSGIYNVGTGIATSFNELVSILNDELKTAFMPEYFDNPYKGTYQENTHADTKKAEGSLGFRAKYSIKDGIHDYIDMLKSQKSHSKGSR